jgi:general secretion pathway protein G
MKTEKRRKVRGFSLIELMVVVAIMAMLAGGVSLFLFGARGEAEKARVKSDFAQIEEALNLFRLKMNRYPESLDELTKPLPGQNEAMFQKGVPKDPWGEPYIYNRTETGFELWTLGADKAEGGSGSDEDLSNMDIDEGEEE